VDPETDRRFAIWVERQPTVDLPYRSDLPQAAELLRDRGHWQHQEQAALQSGDQLAARDARAMTERATRRLTRVEHLPPGDHYPYRWQLRRMGDAIWIALDGEHYNVLQRELRRQFPDQTLVIGTLANGSHVWYVLEKDSYGKGLYQESASVLARGSLEMLMASIAEAVHAVV
jgi:hypothetical protein